MAVYSYQAIDRNGSRTRGIIAADTSRQARDLLRRRDLRIRDLHEQVPQSRNWSHSLRKKPLVNILGSTTRELATLLSVGIHLMDALETLCRQHQGQIRKSLMLLRDRVSKGISLAQAMAEQPDVYDPLTVAMVEVGEHSGNLVPVLNQLADFRDRMGQFKDRVLTALLYPCIVLISAGGVTVFLMIVVVPMLLTNLLEAGHPLPWPTRVLKFFSDALIHHWWIIAIAAGLTMLCIALTLRQKRGRRFWSLLAIRLPLIGTMNQKQIVSRISMVLATLLRSGIVFDQALEIVARTSQNIVIRDALLQASKDIGTGLEMGDVFEKTGIFSPVVVQVIRVGQQSGRLEEMLERLAENCDREVASLSMRIASLVEPVLIIVLAVVVGFILLATLLPILEAGNVL